jgi:hypothetical protein
MIFITKKASAVLFGPTGISILLRLLIFTPGNLEKFEIKLFQLINSVFDS